MILKTFLTLTLLAAGFNLHAYDLGQFIRDNHKSPDKIYKNLHPDAKAYVDRGIKLYQTNEAFRENKFIEFDKAPAKMKPAKIWSHIWEEHGYSEYYQEGYTILNSFEKGEWRYVTIQEKGYPQEILMIDTYAFRKHGDDYLFYPPGLIMDAYTPLDYLDTDNPLQDALLQALLKKRIEENMTEEDKETFKNATSPAEVAELMKKIMEGANRTSPKNNEDK